MRWIYFMIECWRKHRAGSLHCLVEMPPRPKCLPVMKHKYTNTFTKCILHVQNGIKLFTNNCFRRTQSFHSSAKLWMLLYELDASANSVGHLRMVNSKRRFKNIIKSYLHLNQKLVQMCAATSTTALRKVLLDSFVATRDILLECLTPAFRSSTSRTMLSDRFTQVSDGIFVICVLLSLTYLQYCKLHTYRLYFSSMYLSLF